MWCLSVSGHSRLHLLDLGSCESDIGRTREGGGAQCLSLSALGNVVLALANGAKHVPYRYEPGLISCEMPEPVRNMSSDWVWFPLRPFLFLSWRVPLCPPVTVFTKCIFTGCPRGTRPLLRSWPCSEDQRSHVLLKPLTTLSRQVEQEGGALGSTLVFRRTHLSLPLQLVSAWRL